MGLIVVFVFCQCFTIVADVHELICVLGNSNNYITGCPSNMGLLNVNNFISWGHFMLAVNSSVNFIFYMIHIKEFRDAFFKVISDMIITVYSEASINIILVIYYNNSNYISSYFIFSLFAVVYCLLWVVLMAKSLERISIKTKTAKKTSPWMS